MDQLNDYADDRLVAGCAYCGGPGETRDHVPSRVLLDEPYPTNLPVVGCCWTCNNELSRDEEYVACLIEAVIAGTTDPARIRRSRVGEILRRSSSLRARLDAARRVIDGASIFGVEPDRIRRVLLKLARGHATYELSVTCRAEPTGIRWRPLHLMSEHDRGSYEAIHVIGTWGEVGSRSMQRLCVAELTLTDNSGKGSTVGLVVNDWLEVQEGRYRYLATDDGEIRVRVVMGEYLACDVWWNDEARLA